MTQDHRPESAFPTYAAIPAPGDDDLWEKWEAVENTLGIGLDPPLLALEAVAQMNLRINQEIKYQEEPPGADVWQTPEETWAIKSGDCEDYAILKYALLRKAGLPETAMMIIVGEIASMPANIPHAWLLAWVGDAWRVLDNKFDQLIDPADYTNWIPRKGASRDRVLLFSRVFTLNEVADKSHGVSRHSTS
jgi:transglutaminase-like putative cysteine protease